MPELRQDIISGRWSIVATERAKRPEIFSQARFQKKSSGQACPFCETHESLTPPEVDAFRSRNTKKDSPGWQVRVVPNKFPALSMGSQLNSKFKYYQSRAATGYHEVIIHSPDHQKSLATLPLDWVVKVLKMYKRRYQQLAKPPIKSIVIIVNHGQMAGASLEHSHSQIFAMPIVPEIVNQELNQFNHYQQFKKGCPVCLTIKQETSFKDRLIAENKNFLAFCPFASRSPFELLIVPKTHQPQFEKLSELELTNFAQILKQVLETLYKKLKNPPYNYWLHTAPVCYQVNERSNYHWHLEIVPKLAIPAGFELGSGININIVEPTEAAKYMRQSV